MHVIKTENFPTRNKSSLIKYCNFIQSNKFWELRTVTIRLPVQNKSFIRQGIFSHHVSREDSFIIRFSSTVSMSTKKKESSQPLIIMLSKVTFNSINSASYSCIFGGHWVMKSSMCWNWMKSHESQQSPEQSTSIGCVTVLNLHFAQIVTNILLAPFTIYLVS